MRHHNEVPRAKVIVCENVFEAQYNFRVGNLFLQSVASRRIGRRGLAATIQALIQLRWHTNMNIANERNVSYLTEGRAFRWRLSWIKVGRWDLHVRSMGFRWCLRDFGAEIENSCTHVEQPEIVFI